MGNNLNRLKEKFAKKELVIGTTISTNCPTNSEILARCGYDFLWIDGEHGAMDNSDIDLHIMAACSTDCAPIVRVRWNDPVIVKPVLDMGPAGIIFPFIRTVEDVKLAVSSCRYPPAGIRGFGPRRANDYTFINGNEYLKSSESEPFIIIQVEHVDAVNNLEDILNVSGLDAIVVGPNDLSGSIGLLGKTRHSEVMKLYDKIAEYCRSKGILFGCATGVGDQEGIKEWINRGANLLAVDWDIGHLAFSGKHSYEVTLGIYNQLKNRI